MAIPSVKISVYAKDILSWSDLSISDMSIPRFIPDIMTFRTEMACYGFDEAVM